MVGLELMDYIQQMRLKCTACSSANQKLLNLNVPSDQPIRHRVICIWEDVCVSMPFTYRPLFGNIMVVLWANEGLIVNGEGWT